MISAVPSGPVDAESMVDASFNNGITYVHCH